MNIFSGFCGFVLGGVFIISAAQAGQAFQSTRIPVALGGGRTALAEVRTPVGVSLNRPLPAYLVFGGFESAGKVLDLLHPDVPVVLASVDYPFEAPREFHFPGSLAEAPRLKQMIGNMKVGIQSLISALRSRPDVDPERIVLVGASFGSPFAIEAAAESPSVHYLAIVHGFGRVPESAEHVMLRSWEPRYGFGARVAAWLLSRLGWAYLGEDAPENAARKLRADQRVLMITAREDTFIPRASSDSLWEAIAASRAQSQRIFMEGEHLLPGSDGKIRTILEMIRAWIPAS